MHKIVVRRDKTYPFKPYWTCVCGTRMQTPSMTYEFYREFAKHKKEKQKGIK